MTGTRSWELNEDAGRIGVSGPALEPHESVIATETKHAKDVGSAEIVEALGGDIDALAILKKRDEALNAYEKALEEIVDLIEKPDVAIFWEDIHSIARKALGWS